MTVTDPHRHRRTTYLIVGIVVLALVIVGLIVYRRHQPTREAQAKADQLTSAFQQAGLTAPDRDQIIRTLGSDGGAVCANPDNALKQAIRNTLASNGAAGPGMRPVPLARELVSGEILVLQTYCPDELPGFLDYVNKLDFDDTVKE